MDHETTDETIAALRRGKHCVGKQNIIIYCFFFFVVFVFFPPNLSAVVFFTINLINTYLSFQNTVFTLKQS